MIENENGERIASLSDTKDRFVAALRVKSASETHCVQYIAPFTDTVFNQLPIPRLIKELAWLRSEVSETGMANIVADYSLLIEKYLGDPHTFVKFYGD